MLTSLKRGLWVKLGDKAKPAPPTVDLTAEQTETLVTIFNENEGMMDKGSGALACSPEVADKIAKEFAAQTGRIVPANQLVAKLTALRKLPKVDTRPKPEEDTGFGDITKVK